MSTRNVQTVRAFHAAFDGRRLDAVSKLLAPSFAYEDEAHGTVVDRNEFAARSMDSWLGGIGDAQISDARYVDGGDTVVATFTARGTNDGNIGPEATQGRRVAVAFCQIYRFDASGMIAHIESYHNRDSVLQQLMASPRGVKGGTFANAPAPRKARARATAR
jgi:hypothetical protein